MDFSLRARGDRHTFYVDGDVALRFLRRPGARFGRSSVRYPDHSDLHGDDGAGTVYRLETPPRDRRNSGSRDARVDPVLHLDQLFPGRLFWMVYVAYASGDYYHRTINQDKN